MRIIFLLFLCISIIGCSSARKLSKDFSGKVSTINTAFKGEYYSNKPAEIKQRFTVKEYTLWDFLSFYRSDIDSTEKIPDDAILRLTVQPDSYLEVTAFKGNDKLSSFSISTRKEGNYLYLKKNRSMVPIPVVYFQIKEDISFLAPLDNNRLGIMNYNDNTLWILFFGASNTGRTIEEYERISFDSLY
ncbi:hypothetical protein [Sphingobacterium sp. 1.A.5]|jgi:hypothetical protein|uniref:hypothetical protein n=1 Tax=Sphingobacterium sp. 1.A.5 TaxID=2044604 RepID=UPI000C0BBDB3|nr:hypothetical protein [Sphingobacterium sp. 1.A.5]